MTRTTLAALALAGVGTAALAQNLVPHTSYTIDDPAYHLCADGSFRSVYTPCQAAPTASNDSAVTDADTAVTINVLANDSDINGDTLSVSAVGNAANGSASISGNEVVYTPNAGWSGSDSFTYTVSDGNGGEASASVSVTVNAPPPPPNQAPVAATDSATTDQDQSVNINVLSNDSDPDGGSLSVSAVGTPGHGSAVLQSGGIIQYVPTSGWSGSDSFTYTLDDGQGGSATGTVNVTVNPAAPPPPSTCGTRTTVTGQTAVAAGQTYFCGTGSFGAGLNGIFLFGAGDNNVTIDDWTFTGAYRIVESQSAATADTVTIKNITATNIDREGIRLQGTFNNVLIDNVHFTHKAATSSPPDLPEGIHIENGSNITIQNSSFDGFQMTNDPTLYWNGDGIATERATSNVSIINVTADNNTDAGFDLKTPNPWLDNVSASGNSRNYRIWDGLDAGTITIGDVVDHGGTASHMGMWISGDNAAPPTIHIRKLIVRMSTAAQIIKVEDGAANVTIDECDIQAPAGSDLFANPNGGTTNLGPGCVNP